MKTEQEQIEAIKQIIDERVETTLGYVQGRHGNVIKTVDTIIIARDIVDAGYGDVTEYKTEIERLKAENEKLRNEKWDAQDDLDCYCNEMPDKINQAKIDVLNKVKDLMDKYYVFEGVCGYFIDDFKELIKEVENE